ARRARVSVGERGEALALGRQRGELRVGGEVAVADVVDAPRERVDGAHRLALGAREQADAVVEVRRLAAGDLLAAAVGVVDLDGRHGGAHLSALPNSRTKLVPSSALRPPATKPATAIRARPRSVRTSGAPCR